MAEKYWYERWVTDKLPKPIPQGEKDSKRREYMRRWYEDNKDHRKEYMHQYYLDHKDRFCKPRPEHEYKDCRFCGAPFYPVHMTDKFCSAICRRRSYLKRT